MGLPLGDIEKGDLVQYKDPFINNVIFKVKGVTFKATGRGHNVDRILLPNGRWETASLLERPDEEPDDDDLST